MFCPNCGASSEDNSKFCQDCGSSLLQAGSEEVAATTQVAQEAQAEPIPMAPPVFKPQPAVRPPQQAAQVAPKNQVNNSVGVDPREMVYGVGGYLVTLLLLCIPIVNFVLLIVWALSSSVNKNKKNMAIAMLILMVITIAISIGLSATLLPLFSNMLN